MKSLFFRLLFVVACLTSSFTWGQTSGVAINDNGNPPDPAAILDVSSAAKGLLIPRMTTSERDAIATPSQSLLIYNTTSKCYEFFESSVWNVMSCGCTPPSAPGVITGSDDVCEGQTGVTYSIAPVIGAIGYVWSLPDGASVVSGFNTTDITVDYAMGATSGDVTVYAVSQSCGNSASSAAFPVVVNALVSPDVSISVSPGNTVCSGVEVTFTATPVNGGDTPSYQWKVNGSDAGTDNPAFSSSSLANGDVVTCEMTSSLCTSGSPAVSNGITMAVTQGSGPLSPPSIYTGKTVYSYTGGDQTFTVPQCVTQIYVKLWGAGGAGGTDSGSSGGAGAYAGGYLSVTENTQLTVIVGGGGTRSSSSSAPGGYGGGGASGASSCGSCSNGGGWSNGSGGGRSAIQVTPGVDVATAGGGGGAGGIGWNSQRPYGGGGGAQNGNDGSDGNNGPGGNGRGRGATTSAGGAATDAGGGSVNSTAGSSLTGSPGANAGYGGGGGGGGYYGGSGGAGSVTGTTSIGGGGGGSSYTANLTSVVNIAGSQGTSGPYNGANSGDVDYATGVGRGASVGNNGGNGRVVIYW